MHARFLVKVKQQPDENLNDYEPIMTGKLDVNRPEDLSRSEFKCNETENSIVKAPEKKVTFNDAINKKNDDKIKIYRHRI